VAFEPEEGLFTEVALTAGSGAHNHEAAVAQDLLADEETPVTVLGDTAYGTGELREHLKEQGHELVLRPTAPQAGRPRPSPYLLVCQEAESPLDLVNPG
jgi:hypothetical protein